MLGMRPAAASTGRTEIAIAIGGIPLLDGAFPISIQLKDRHDGRLLDFREGQDVFEVVNPSKAGGSVLFPVSVETTRAGQPHHRLSSRSADAGRRD